MLVPEANVAVTAKIIGKEKMPFKIIDNIHIVPTLLGSNNPRECFLYAVNNQKPVIAGTKVIAAIIKTIGFPLVNNNPKPDTQM